MNQQQQQHLATDTPVLLATTELLIVAKAENNPQEQALLVTEDDEGNEIGKSAELIEALSTKRILLQLQLTDEYTIKQKKSSGSY